MRHPHPRYAAPARPVSTARLQQERAALIEALRQARQSNAMLQRERQQLVGALKESREANGPLRELVARQSNQLESLTAQLAQQPAPEEDDREQALRADLANLRRQQQASTRHAVRQEKAKLLAPIGDVYDALKTALQTSTEPDSPWHTGIEQLTAQIRNALLQQQVTLVGGVGDVFNPTHHEAVGVVEGGEADRIVAVQRHGLAMADGSLLRPARVVVSKGVNHG